MNLRQLLRGATWYSEAAARHILRERPSERVLAALENHCIIKKAAIAQSSKEDNKWLKLREVRMFGTLPRALLDSGAVSNITSVALCDHLLPEPQEKN